VRSAAFLTVTESSTLLTAVDRSGAGLLVVRLPGLAEGSFQYGPIGCISFSSISSRSTLIVRWRA
jgi:hypothetical protein